MCNTDGVPIDPGIASSLGTWVDDFLREHFGIAADEPVVAGMDRAMAAARSAQSELNAAAWQPVPAGTALVPCTDDLDPNAGKRRGHSPDMV
jgi:hypothetical protein